MIEPQILVDESPADAAVGASTRRRLTVGGIVQGVGFRPHVWRLAHEHGLGGFVRNTSGGVIIEVEGTGDRLDAFRRDLTARAPALARIDRVAETAIPTRGEPGFTIVESRAVSGQYQPLSPDAATCEDCLRELRDPGDRRYGHPFINCTNCGPRFTIIEDVPYDRPLTTMRVFPMCARCQNEYEDPADRRFHAQPIACPDCGPRLWFADAQGEEEPGTAIDLATEALLSGSILAIKGLGGFQLACDATNEAAVRRLRDRKHRPAKPFAVMVRDLGAARRFCRVTEAEEAALTSPARPIVLLRRAGAGTVAGGAAAVARAAEAMAGAAGDGASGAGTRADQPSHAGVAPAVAPHLDELGVMLPYTPVHHLLLAAVDRPLVMTSGNLSEEPIAKDNDEALARLSRLVDGLLLHDRDIYARYDDSVVRVMAAEPRMVRRARGYCPVAIDIDGAADVLAFGSYLKNTFCIVKDGHAFVGPHIGDLDHPLSLGHQDEALTTYLRLFRSRPSTAACDLHPDYASTRLAEAWPAAGGAEPVRVQHHHAHIASVMAEHGLRGPMIGVAFDGTGYGPDGTVWGGEFLVCDEVEYTRAGHLAPVRQPGGDLCAREGWRMAASYLLAARLPLEPPPGAGAEGVDDRRWRLVTRLAGSEMAPLSSSAGRLFDAVASLLGVGHLSTFEAECAMRLEAVAAAVDPTAVEPLPLDLGDGDVLVLDGPALVRRLLEQRERGRSVAELAAVFHETLAHAITDVCLRIGARARLERVALSGGVFQNARLLERTAALLARHGLDVHANRSVPANDGGVSLGQALVAGSRMARS